MSNLSEIFRRALPTFVDPDAMPDFDWACCSTCDWSGPWSSAHREEEGNYEEGYWTAYYCPNCDDEHSELEPTYSPEGIALYDAWERRECIKEKCLRAALEFWRYMAESAKGFYFASNHPAIARMNRCAQAVPALYEHLHRAAQFARRGTIYSRGKKVVYRPESDRQYVAHWVNQYRRRVETGYRI